VNPNIRGEWEVGSEVTALEKLRGVAFAVRPPQPARESISFHNRNIKPKTGTRKTGAEDPFASREPRAARRSRACRGQCNPGSKSLFIMKKISGKSA